jgi:anti-sigma factor RsiW
VWLIRKRRGLSCQELVELVTDYLDGALSRADRARFEAHIDACTNCREYLAQFEQTIAVTGTLREDDVDPAARDALLAQFSEWRNESSSS